MNFMHLVEAWQGSKGWGRRSTLLPASQATRRWASRAWEPPR